MQLLTTLITYNNRAKIIGSILIVIGLCFFIDPTSLNIKIGFASILIGIFTMFMLTKKTITQKISTEQIEGNIDTIKNIIKTLQIKGNAIFLPKTDNLTEERILIPQSSNPVVEIPKIQNDSVFLKTKNGRNLGISIPPSGLKLINKIEKEEKFDTTEIKNLEEKLQIFVGMDLVKSLSLKQIKTGWKLEIEKPSFCPNDSILCAQYPCPICSAILTAITRSTNGSNHKLWIKDITYDGKKTTFHVHFLKRKTN